MEEVAEWDTFSEPPSRMDSHSHHGLYLWIQSTPGPTQENRADSLGSSHCLSTRRGQVVLLNWTPRQLFTWEHWKAGGYWIVPQNMQQKTWKNIQWVYLTSISKKGGTIAILCAIHGKDEEIIIQRVEAFIDLLFPKGQICIRHLLLLNWGLSHLKTPRGKEDVLGTSHPPKCNRITEKYAVSLSRVPFFFKGCNPLHFMVMK